MMRNRMEEFDLDQPRQDTELTLGPAMLIGLACVLLLVCGACFGVGYMVGHRGAHPDAATAQTANETPAEQPSGASAKPTASGAIPAAPAAVVPTSADAPANAGAAGDASTSSAPAASANASPATSSLVHPALPQPGTVQAATTTQTAAPASGPASGTMVQIAAVSHAEDADVLMGALRKRGYAVTARRMAGDSLIHVQIGPFASRAEANAMSQKLLGDGYNAVVLP